MKRYHLFVGYDYYPSKFSDYRGSFESVNEAISAIGDDLYDVGLGFKWFQILRTNEDGSLTLEEEGC